jgi:hypothetical protein
MCRIEFHAPANLFDRIPHPYPATRAVPEWLKNMPMDRGEGGTIKRCPPFVEAITAGYIIPVPFDVALSVSAEGVLSAKGADPDFPSVSAHHDIQYQGSPFQHSAVLKFRNPWVILTPSDYVCLITAPINRLFELPLLPLTGIVETSQYYREVNVPSVCMMRPGQTATARRGSPLVQVIPIRREAWTSTAARQDATRRRDADQPFAADRHAYKEGIWKKLEYT